MAFYLSDFWALWDVAIVASGVAFLVCRVIGLARHDRYIIDTAFDILAMEALFLVPRLATDFRGFVRVSKLTFIEDIFVAQPASLLRNLGDSAHIHVLGLIS